MSGQTRIFIAVIVFLFLFFLWSSMTAKRSGNYEDIPTEPQAKPAERR